VRWKKGYGIVTLLATAPFPYIEETDLSPKGLLVSFDKKLQKNDWKHIYFEGVAFDKKHKKFYVADYQGYALYVAHFGKTVEVARKGMYDIIRKIYIPKMFYRNDIGEKFLAEGRRKLKNLGIF
jgi:phosphoribosylamine-glycine ligase